MSRRKRQGVARWVALWVGMAGLTGLAPPVWADALGVYTEVRAEAWSNGLPVMDLNGDWATGYRRLAGTQQAYASARAEAGAWWRQATGEALQGAPLLRAGALYRADATARMSGDAAEVLRLYQQKQDPSPPARYDASTRMRYWTGRGLTLQAVTPSWRGLSLSLGWDALRLQRLRSLATTGQVSYLADGSYAYAGRLHDDDSRYQALFMTGPEAQGQGAALSVALQAEPTRWASDADVAEVLPTRLRLSVDDAWSRLSWGGVNGNDAVLNSQVQTRDADGRVDYQAAIQGLYTRRKLVERIPVRSALQLDWQRPSGLWSLQVVSRLGLWQRWASWQGPWAVQPSVGVDPVARAWRAGLAWQGLQLGYTSGLGDGAQRIRGLTLSLSCPLWADAPR